MGRMLFEASIPLDIELNFLDPDPNAPCKNLGNSFRVGELTDSDTVVEFGKDLDLITIEIERVSVEGLKKLRELGKEISPSPEIIKMVQNKILQKEFFESKGFPTAPFQKVQDKKDLLEKASLPFVNKIAVGGYDGRGVELIETDADLDRCFDAPGIIEKKANMEKELSVVVCRNGSGQVECFPTVEMVFDPRANLVDYLLSPAEVAPETEQKALELARSLAEELDLVGIMAVEMFLNQDGSIWVNELAPRPHNSGHQTIEGNHSSQYDQHLRSILGLPLGDCSLRSPSAMINILGAEGFSGDAVYQGIEEVLGIQGAYIHLYGKKVTKPFRKMGHVTVLGSSREELKMKIDKIKSTLIVRS